jgi:hypothetical protein
MKVEKNMVVFKKEMKDVRKGSNQAYRDENTLHEMRNILDEVIARENI